jgi:hypothetical protein
LVEDHAADFLEQWHDFFDSDERGSDSAD